MVKIIPFRGFRYNYEFLGELKKYLSPLFDVVSIGMLARLYSNPLNSIHLVVPRSPEEAGQTLISWKNSNILVQETLPTIYVLKQIFKVNNKIRQRTGIIALVELDKPNTPLSKRNFVIHENVVKNVVEKQKELLKQTLLNAAPTHSFFYEESSQFREIIQKYANNPLFKITDYQGVENHFSLIQSRKDINALQEILRDKKIFLADGHHRLKASEEFYEEATGNNFVKYHLTFINNIAEETKRILPINRVIKMTEEIPDLLLQLKKYFIISGIDFNPENYYTNLDYDKLIMQYKNNYFLLHINEEGRKTIGKTGFYEEVKELAYSHLHYLIIEKILGIPYPEQLNYNQIRYVKITEPPEDLHESTLAFFMPGIPIGKMMNIARSGNLMPPKSTYFYPKLNTGFVFASINDKDYETGFDSCF